MSAGKMMQESVKFQNTYRIRGQRDMNEAVTNLFGILNSLDACATNVCKSITAFSEILSNAVKYADYAEITVTVEQRQSQLFVHFAYKDQGPGIANIEAALQDGVSASNSLGIGLGGIKRLMDEFTISSNKIGLSMRCRKKLSRDD